MRSMGSADAFHSAYFHATQPALLEAHELSFAYYGGVFGTLRYDIMKSVVQKILRGRQRIETDKIIAFRSHWRYQSEYCARRQTKQDGAPHPARHNLRDAGGSRSSAKRVGFPNAERMGAKWAPKP